MGPNRPKNGYFQRLISRERKKLSKIWFNFRNPQSFLYKKCHCQIFRISTPSPSKLSPNIGTEKSPNSGFSIFSISGGRIFFILHSQLEDHKGLLQWRFHIHCISGSRLMALGPIIWDPKLVFQLSRVSISQLSWNLAVSYRTIRADLSKNFMLIAFSVLDFWPLGPIV